MTKREERSRSHLASDVLVRAMDDELPASEAAHVELHLSQCNECRARYQELQAISKRVDGLAYAIVPQPVVNGREVLEQKLDARQPQVTAMPTGKVLQRFGWGMAIAATLALGIVFAPGKVQHGPSGSASGSVRPAIDTFEVNGETFVALPYSNPDLPISSSHIVQMQVPVSSLTEAGVSFEPVSTQEAAFNHSVLADVLVGLDGQPLGVHVVSME